MGEEVRRANTARPREAMYAHDLVVRDVELDVSDPKSKSPVGRDVDAPHGIVPEPGDGDEVAYGDGNDSAVRADGDGGDQDRDEYRLEDEEAEFECYFSSSWCALVGYSRSGG